MRGRLYCGSNCELILLIQTKLDHGGLGGLFERMFLISIKRVSSYFPESQLYYSTLAKLMMKQDLDLSADDDDVRSWLDALNERELSR